MPKEIKARDIEFNWGAGGPDGFTKPGLWADAGSNTRWSQRVIAALRYSGPTLTTGHAMGESRAHGKHSN